MTDYPSKLELDDELLSAYLDGELTADEQAAVEARLSADPAAAELLHQLRAVSQAVQGLPQEVVGRDLGGPIARLVEGDSKTRYLAIYELETDDPQRDLATLTAAAGTDRMRMTDALDLPKATTALFEQISEFKR